MEATATNVSKPEWRYNLVGLTSYELGMISGAIKDLWVSGKHIIEQINKILEQTAKGSGN